ncbi:hypothetical protein M404DRAFT_33177 [Pisolithus tinctorius Marx 270]|uniref:Uncharacterized protein n=1 Tax=Pisolithus tinctorius Marx 270 TaxID=870435 RepID=A0A0C3IHI7_PISTI|nr:hypothetical protein M404DRAFT_33177 [Pisolithus tinctorius Marx 270]
MTMRCPVPGSRDVEGISLISPQHSVVHEEGPNLLTVNQESLLCLPRAGVNPDDKIIKASPFNGMTLGRLTNDVGQGAVEHR